ncbi:MAG: peptide chain release factor 1 [Chloroflexi bacterium]|nr:peptide chain release factor 1 [Chloroflexota bacterium]
MLEQLHNKLDGLIRRYDDLAEQMGRPEIATDYTKVQAMAKERASLERVVNLYKEYKKVSAEIAETQAMVQNESDRDLAAMAKDELAKLQDRRDRLAKDIQTGLLPKDPNDEKSVIFEIRAGTGGNEAGLFAADLFRMYQRYAQTHGWKVEVLDSNESGIGGFKEIIFEVDARGAYSRLKHESGVHRVQRVPDTEASGRIHTSTATVAVLPEADEVEVHVNPEDIRIDIYHASGHGGQNVQKVATAVRIVHNPTGIVAVCQDERSQLKNKMKAMAILRARILDIKMREQEAQITDMRRSQVGTAERSEKIRTYNYPQNRVTDHRLEMSFHNLPAVLEGNLDEVIDALVAREQAQRMQEAVA